MTPQGLRSTRRSFQNGGWGHEQLRRRFPTDWNNHHANRNDVSRLFVWLVGFVCCLLFGFVFFFFCVCFFVGTTEPVNITFQLPKTHRGFLKLQGLGSAQLRETLGEEGKELVESWAWRIWARDFSAGGVKIWKYKTEKWWFSQTFLVINSLWYAFQVCQLMGGFQFFFFFFFCSSLFGETRHTSFHWLWATTKQKKNVNDSGIWQYLVYLQYHMAVFQIENEGTRNWLCFANSRINENGWGWWLRRLYIGFNILKRSFLGVFFSHFVVHFS